MIVRKLTDHLVQQSPTCGEIHELLVGMDYSPNVAIAYDIGVTTPHYHNGFDETYFVLEGWIDLHLYAPHTDQFSEHHLEANELVVITRGIHHQVVKSAPKNRLCVLTMPRFDIRDEHPSDKLGAGPSANA